MNSKEDRVRLFITGGNGYIGSFLIEYLSNVCPKWFIYSYDLVNGDDILDYENLVTKMEEVSPSVVIHLAACSSVYKCNEDPEFAFRTNGLGTRNVLMAMKVCGCNNIIYSSTCAVYGSPTALPVIESDKFYGRLSHYALSKLMGEHVIFSLSENYLIFRLFNVVGGFQRPGNDRLFGALSTSKSIVIYGDDYPTQDGTCVRDYVSLLDVSNAFYSGIMKLVGFEESHLFYPSPRLLCPSSSFSSSFPERECLNSIRIWKWRIREVINICSGDPWSVKEIIDQWNNIIIDPKNPMVVHYEYGSRREGDIPKIYGSSNKASIILDWKSKDTLFDIIMDCKKDLISRKKGKVCV